MEFGLGKSGANEASGATSVVKDTTTADFAKDVLEASRDTLVLLDCWADWCGPCKQLTPVLEKVVQSYGGRVRLVKLNVDEHPAIAGQLRIQSLPTVYAFRDGRPLDGFMGLQPESAIRELIDRLVAPDEAADIEAALSAAADTLNAGDLHGAAELYAAILQEDRQNAGALAGLANCYLKSGDIARAEQTMTLIPPDQRSNPAVASLIAAIELAQKASQAGDTTELAAKVSAEPDNHQARLDLALALAAHDDKDGALDQLLELFRRDRNWNEEAARKQLLQLFEAWGPKDPSTLEGRRRLSSMIFA